jgi:two-component system response regulator YesN
MYSLLIAEDEEIERKALRLLIHDNFPEIRVLDDAKNGIEFLQNMILHTPDIAIVDIDMPGMNGIEALKILRKLELSTEIIISTAYGRFEYAQEAIPLKAEEFLLKPMRSEAIIGAIGTCIGKIADNRQRKSEHDRLRQLSENILPIVETDIMFSLLLGEVDETTFLRSVNSLGLGFKAGLVMSVMIPEQGEGGVRNADKAEIQKNVKEIAASVCTALVSPMINNRIALLVILESERDDRQVGRWATELAQVIRNRTQERLMAEVAVGIGNAYSSAADMVRSYDESLEALSEKSNRDSMMNDIVSRGMDYIHKNYMKDISLDDLAKNTGNSPYYFSRLFKKTIGETFVEHLTRTRVDMAIEKMKQRKYSIKELSEEVGYNNPTYFCKVFKKITGKTITEFQK